MVLGHLDNRRPFKPTGAGGGSKKGKPQSEYPLIILVVADAIHIQVKGTIDAMIYDRNMKVSAKEMRKRLDELLPGVWNWIGENMPGRATDRAVLMCNRVYKMYYSGTSDRGFGHDPKTRAVMSGEHWRVRDGGMMFESLRERIIRGRIHAVKGWKKWAW